jgi:hypothetical protein
VAYCWTCKHVGDLDGDWACCHPSTRIQFVDLMDGCLRYEPDAFSLVEILFSDYRQSFHESQVERLGKELIDLVQNQITNLKEAPCLTR